MDSTIYSRVQIHFEECIIHIKCVIHFDDCDYHVEVSFLYKTCNFQKHFFVNLIIDNPIKVEFQTKFRNRQYTSRNKLNRSIVRRDFDKGYVCLQKLYVRCRPCISLLHHQRLNIPCNPIHANNIICYLLWIMYMKPASIYKLSPIGSRRNSIRNILKNI